MYVCMYVFLPYGQVGVGARGGLETAIHTLKSYITTNSSRENLCCFKVDMRHAFNECHREKFLPQLREEFPELVAGCSGVIVHQENLCSANIAFYQLLALNRETH